MSVRLLQPKGKSNTGEACQHGGMSANPLSPPFERTRSAVILLQPTSVGEQFLPSISQFYRLSCGSSHLQHSNLFACMPEWLSVQLPRSNRQQAKGLVNMSTFGNTESDTLSMCPASLCNFSARVVSTKFQPHSCKGDACTPFDGFVVDGHG